MIERIELSAEEHDIIRLFRQLKKTHTGHRWMIVNELTSIIKDAADPDSND